MLTITNLSIRFKRYTHNLMREEIEVVSALNMRVCAGEVHAIIGASGSGKSLLAHAILGILPSNAGISGSIFYQDKALTRERLKKLRGGEIAFIPQSISYLDPSMKTGTQISGGKHSRQETFSVMRSYGLLEDVFNKYPHELSGGMARRVLVASAVLDGAKLLIADEPTPGLSEYLAREMLESLRRLADSGCAVMLITHDIILALAIADRISIFNAGASVETAPRSAFSGDGKALHHPYSKALWKALPQNGFEVCHDA